MSGNLTGQVDYRPLGLIAIPKVPKLDWCHALSREVHTKWQNARHDGVTDGYDRG